MGGTLIRQIIASPPRPSPHETRHRCHERARASTSRNKLNTSACLDSLPRYCHRSWPLHAMSRCRPVTGSLLPLPLSWYPSTSSSTATRSPLLHHLHRQPPVPPKYSQPCPSFLTDVLHSVSITKSSLPLSTIPSSPSLLYNCFLFSLCLVSDT